MDRIGNIREHTNIVNIHCSMKMTAPWLSGLTTHVRLQQMERGERERKILSLKTLEGDKGKKEKGEEDKGDN